MGGGGGGNVEDVNSKLLNPLVPRFREFRFGASKFQACHWSNIPTEGL